MTARRRIVVGIALVALALSLTAGPIRAEPPRVSTFRMNITPPLGSPLCGGWIKPLVDVDDPLWAKGLVIENGDERYVLCALDWCEVRNAAHDSMREQLGLAADTAPQHVAVQCLHQHNAPIVDTAAQRLMDEQPRPLPTVDVRWFEEIVDRLAAEVHASLARLEPFDGVAVGTAEVDRVASSRRIPDGNGGITVRYSSAKDPALRALPEGLIDPVLRTVTLLDGERPIVRLHHYATHPQSYYGDGRASSEFPGLARDRIEREERVPQIYFTGCAGNVAAGKYNDGTPLARYQLTERMAAGMRASIAASEHVSFGPIAWRTVPVVLPPRTDGRWSPETARGAIADPDAPVQARLQAAMALAYHARAEQPIELCALQIGDVHLLHLPGEPFVEFQLYAQQLLPDAFVTVAGYADGGPGYVCTASSFEEGGYEPTASGVAPKAEERLKQGIRALLDAE